MIALNCNNIGFSYGTDTIIKNISFSLQENDKAGLVGVNGAGKSTLFKIITGELHQEEGDLFISKDLVLGYLRQNAALNTENTLWEELLEVFDRLVSMEGTIKKIEKEISITTDQDKLDSLMKEYGKLTERFAYLGGFEYNSRIRGVLRGLGFLDSEFDSKVNILSGGQKTRLALAKVLLEEPDILLLDEPTNHLDIAAVEWLEDYLKSYKKCLLIISHDRYFLDSVTNRTIEIENKTSTFYNTNYSGYVKQKAINREIQEKHYLLQQKEIARQEAIIEQQRRFNREKNIIAAESRLKALDRMVRLDKPQEAPDKVRMKFNQAMTSGNDVLELDSVSKAYGNKKLFDNISFKIRKAERVFLLGPNGCGKSTLLKILAGRLAASSGKFNFGAKVDLGYYDQEMEDLNEDNTVLDEVWSVNQKLIQTEVRSALAAFLFSGEDVFKKISVLSGGEKSRVSMLKLIFSEANFIILDEPTNHLDINSREILEAALADYEGTMLIVSHDRYFIDKLATRIIDIGVKPPVDCIGNYTYFASHYKKNISVQNAASEANPISEAKQSRIATKEERSRIRKLEKQLADTEKEIASVERRLGDIDNEMVEAATDHMKLIELSEEKNSKERSLEELYAVWAEVTEQLENQQGG
ncbi:ribosomal protection-like ABC-F family protein [Ruminiclostridium cellobioparum]|uniref:ABC transporter n=1 Tax=Ruminiclostridium cellobioparum subsp. termitidis CT1112 TaxID=1195236 RepID=S0FHA7_RUMCE|nr:ABC-F family ATP-binding cassette domain-containing protein [Ruminiclostridium cellobioparum]EMS70762.1 ABC transporter [Ruminiclostridium cellobioparum subsp. termitidis CT1112]